VIGIGPLLFCHTELTLSKAFHQHGARTSVITEVGNVCPAAICQGIIPFVQVDSACIDFVVAIVFFFFLLFSFTTFFSLSFYK
jgi:hypothetical protein